MRLSGRPRQVRARLDAVELDAPRAFARWLAEHRRPLGQILEHGTLLDREDVEAMLDLSIPGVDELVGLMEIERLAGRRYDLIIVDTAPTGHTLRLLAAPETVTLVSDVLDALQEEHRVIREQLAHVGGRPELADQLIEMLAAQAQRTSDRLRGRSTEFRWVTLPEALSIAESEDAIAALEEAGIRVTDIIVNRVLPDASPCPVCDRRRAEERIAIGKIHRGIGRRRRLYVVPAEIVEPRGMKALAKIAKKISTTADAGDAEVESHRTSSSASPVSSVVASSNDVAAESLAAITGASLIFFGGKGGAGKTTVAAATALRIARAHREARVLLLSTDPAHSLADVLRAPITDTPSRIAGAPPNLLVRELDAPRALAARRVDLAAAFSEIASAFGAGDAGRSVSRAGELMNLAPPGIDELFGIVSVFEARAAYDTIVVDTAPTGHALRLLEMPDAAREWTHTLMRVLMKYRALVRPGQLGAELVGLAKSVRDLQSVLRDPVRTKFLIVTRAAELPQRETERLARRLKTLRLSTPAIVVNTMTLAPGSCRRCRATATAERRVVTAMPRGGVIIQAPLAAPPPRGVAALESWAGRWIIERTKR